MTGITSSLLGTATDVLQASGDIFYRPYQELRRVPHSNYEHSDSRTSSITSLTANSVNSHEGKKDSKLKMTGSILKGSAKSAGRMVGFWYKGMLVDMPLAVSDGLGAVPRLYGDEVKDHGNIRDWKSGATFAGKNFVHGMAEGLTDIFSQPYKGGQKEGAKGVIKGLAKGTLGTTTKVSSGMCISVTELDNR